jgi:phage-related protein
MDERDIIWYHGEVKTPPFSSEARVEVGHLLRLVQEGVLLSLPQSRPMPSIGRRCHELRVQDAKVIWRIVYRIDTDAIVVVEVFAKKTSKTPKDVIEVCIQRLATYDREVQQHG